MWTSTSNIARKSLQYKHSIWNHSWRLSHNICSASPVTASSAFSMNYSRNKGLHWLIICNTFTLFSIIAVVLSIWALSQELFVTFFFLTLWKISRECQHCSSASAVAFISHDSLNLRQKRNKMRILWSQTSEESFNRKFYYVVIL